VPLVRVSCGASRHLWAALVDVSGTARAGHRLGLDETAGPNATATCYFRVVIKRLRMKPLGIGGWVWWLSILWVGIDAAASGYVFLTSTQPVTVSGDVGPAWLNSPWLLDVIAIGAWLALAVWLVLAIPVLYAGIGQFAPRGMGCGWLPGVRFGSQASPSPS
jgi:hypothetical protein